MTQEMNDLPTPRFCIGQTVYAPDTTQISKCHPCPDCLGAKHWTVKTPGGGEYKISCQRCASSYRERDISLDYAEHVAIVKSLTVGSIRVDTASYRDTPVEYMCKETGIGSGTIWDEAKLCGTKEEAKFVAGALAAEKNRIARTTPERIAQQRLAGLNFKDATLDLARSATWNAWYAYRRLAEDVEEAISVPSTFEELKEALEDKLRYEQEYREQPPLDKLLRALTRAVETESVAGLREVLEDLPDEFRVLAGSARNIPDGR